ncbi:MAG: superoxide dismutase family protein [Chloroflexi bacterium]|nr:superoxide dismutase family protein [Chloroflexota bacterium]
MTAVLAVSLFVMPQAAGAAAPSRQAKAMLHDGTGAMIGWALFSDSGQRGVRVVVVAWGLGEGLHGLHIHATGSCVAPTFTSAGSHFNPLNTLHGSHAGDLPNLPVGPNGIGHLVTSSTGFTLLPGQLSIFDNDGAALVVHAGPDDYVTNPTGNSGSRVACGVIAPFGSARLGGT